MRTKTRLDFLLEHYRDVCIWFDGTGRVFVGGDLLGRFSLGYWSKPYAQSGLDAPLASVR